MSEDHLQARVAIEVPAKPAAGSQWWCRTGPAAQSAGTRSGDLSKTVGWRRGHQRRRCLKGGVEGGIVSGTLPR
jgi:hypothetical protein